MTNSKILGISCFYHDSAAALVRNGKLVCAVQEERFTRNKHDDGFPKNAIEYCLKSQDLKINDIDAIVFYEKPILKFERLITTFIRVWPRGITQFIPAMRAWLKKKLWVERTIRKELGYKGKILFSEHHYSHAASAYFCSGFDHATIVTIDGVGEYDTTAIGFGDGKKLTLEKSIHFPHSLGLLYSALTYYLGFKVNDAEYKVMGLAPYGDPDTYKEHFDKLIKIYDDGSFELDMRYFSYEYGLKMTNRKFDELFGSPPREPDGELTQRHKDIAAALQKKTEEAVLKIVEYAKKKYPSENLCLAGGVALNCVANSKIMDTGLFKNIYVQPASSDAGGAVGAAMMLEPAVMNTVYLGTEYDIEEFVKDKPHYKPDNLEAEVARLVAENKVVGLFQGKMEFGARALGNRSILADARKLENWRRVNLKIKFRESFRPFAPAVLEEYAEDYFTMKRSPYMLFTAQVKRDDIPAVTHIDNSARLQTVNESQNPRFYKILKEFHKLTGCPVMINTSFNRSGEPIVCSPQDAYDCFLKTEMDCLVIGNYVIIKK